MHVSGEYHKFTDVVACLFKESKFCSICGVVVEVFSKRATGFHRSENVLHRISLEEELSST